MSSFWKKFFRLIAVYHEKWVSPLFNLSDTRDIIIALLNDIKSGKKFCHQKEECFENDYFESECGGGGRMHIDFMLAFKKQINLNKCS